MGAPIRDIEVRLARPEEAAKLTEIARRAKSSWGYDESFMEACAAELTVTPRRIASGHMFCADSGPVTLGFASIRQEIDTLWLDDLFVDPHFHGGGAGTALIRKVVQEARVLGRSRVKLHADPHSKTIYENWGFETIGVVPSASIENRWLPIMERVL